VKTDRSPETDPTLEALRSQIDAVDEALLAQLNERARLVGEVGRLKAAAGAGVYAAAREQAIVERLARANPGPFPSAALGAVYREIISGTRSLEGELAVAYLGPEGTYSHQAARELLGAQACYAAQPSIEDVFGAVERGRCALGLVPVENTTEGIVTATFDAFARFELSICAESVLRIRCDLLSLGGRLDDIESVASHPQPLAQCRGWLDRNLPGRARIETPSTIAAARLAAGDPKVAAIASPLAAETFSLAAAAESIEDQRDNTTRFAVIGRDAAPPSGRDLTSALFTIRRDEAGGLFRLLQPFAEQRVNLTSIQLRPMPGKPWEYVFFLDFEGHHRDARVATALRGAAAVAHSVRLLGSYPRAARAGR
jgi:chorismate mutase/prephenate dehydratase